MPITNLPKDFDRFLKLKKFIKKDSIRLHNVLNRFSYRYRLAKSLKDMTFEDVGKVTTEGYKVLTKLVLAYSAYDEVRIVEQFILDRETPKIHQYKKNKELAERVRKNEDLMKNFLHEENEVDAILKSHLKKFQKRKSNDLMCVITAFRNSYAHGDLTASGGGLRTKKDRQVIYELCDCLFELSDEIFTKNLNYFEELYGNF